MNKLHWELGRLEDSRESNVDTYTSEFLISYGDIVLFGMDFMINYDKDLHASELSVCSWGDVLKPSGGWWSVNKHYTTLDQAQLGAENVLDDMFHHLREALYALERV